MRDEYAKPINWAEYKYPRANRLKQVALEEAEELAEAWLETLSEDTKDGDVIYESAPAGECQEKLSDRITFNNDHSNWDKGLNKLIPNEDK